MCFDCGVPGHCGSNIIQIILVSVKPILVLE